MRTIQSKQIAPIPNAREFDRIMANVGLTVEGLTSGSGGSGGGGTTVINNTTEVTNNYLFVSDYVVAPWKDKADDGKGLNSLLTEQGFRLLEELPGVLRLYGK